MDEDSSSKKSRRGVVSFIGSFFTRDAFRQYWSALNFLKYDKERVLIWNLSSWVTLGQVAAVTWVYKTFPWVQTAWVILKSVASAVVTAIVTTVTWTVSVIAGLIAMLLAPTP